MAVAHVQSTASSEGSNVNSLSVTFGSSTTTGNLIVVNTSIWDNDGTPPGGPFTITDNKGNDANYAQAIGGTVTGTKTRIEQHYCPNATGGASHQITSTPGDQVYMTVGVTELSGAATTSPITGTPSFNQGTGTAVTSGSVTPGANGMFVAMCSYVYASASRTITPNWTSATQRLEIDENSDTSDQNVLTKAATASSSDNAAWTLSGSESWGALLVAYKEAGAGGGSIILPVGFGGLLNMAGGFRG